MNYNLTMDANTLAAQQYAGTMAMITILGVCLIGATVGIIAMWWYYRGRNKK